MAISATLRSAVTIWNSDGGFDPNVSPIPALMQGVAGESIRKRVRTSPGLYYDIRVAVETSSGSRVGRQALLSLAGDVAGKGLVSWGSWSPSGQFVAVRDEPACARIIQALMSPS